MGLAKCVLGSKCEIDKCILRSGWNWSKVSLGVVEISQDCLHKKVELVDFKSG